MSSKFEIKILIENDGENIGLSVKNDLSGDCSVWFGLFCKAMKHQVLGGLESKMELSKDFAQLGEMAGECTCREDDEEWIEDEE